MADRFIAGIQWYQADSAEVDRVAEMLRNGDAELPVACGYCAGMRKRGLPLVLTDKTHKLFIPYMQKGVVNMTAASRKSAKSTATSSKTEDALEPAATPTPAEVVPPKPARKRAPAAAKVAPAVVAAPVESQEIVTKSPAKRSQRAAKPQVEAAAKPAAPVKAKKTKLVRDSFTMPGPEYAALSDLKKRCLGLGIAAKKSELLRAAVAVLAGLSDAEVAAAIQGLEVIKTGRPAKGK
jgi:hypothetical protein